MIDAFNVLTHVASRVDCPPDIAAAILWSLDSLTTPETTLGAETPVVEPVAEAALQDASAFVRPGRPLSITYEDAEKVYREWKSLGNISLAAQRVGVSYNAAWAVCRGKTYPEIAGRSYLVNQADGGKKRANLPPEKVRAILQASKTTGMAEIGRQMDIPFATVQSVINRRTAISRQIAGDLGMPTVGPNARGPRKK